MTKKTEAFSLDIFDAKGRHNKGAVLHLINPATGKPAFNGNTPVTITMLGKKSDTNLDYVQQLVRDARKEAAKNPKAKSKAKEDDFNIRETIDEISDKLAKMTIGFTGIDIALDHESKKQLYITYGDIREQADEFFNDADGVNFI